MAEGRELTRMPFSLRSTVLERECAKVTMRTLSRALVASGHSYAHSLVSMCLRVARARFDDLETERTVCAERCAAQCGTQLHVHFMHCCNLRQGYSFVSLGRAPQLPTRNLYETSHISRLFLGSSESSATN